MLTISLRRWGNGWSVCRCDAALFSHLSLSQAIELARVVACDEHLRLHQSIRVEMPGMHSHIVLAHFAEADTDQRALRV